MKRNVVVLILLLFMIPASSAQADETNYESQGNVGFTGVWKTPPSSEEPQELPVTAKTYPVYLPKTGDETTSSFLTSLVGASLLLLMVSYEKFRRDRGGKKA